MKVGDKIYCYNNHINTNNLQNITIGKEYEIISIDDSYNEFCIYNDDNKKRYYYFDNEDFHNDLFYYEKWFYSEQKYRQFKLEKLILLSDFD